MARMSMVDQKVLQMQLSTLQAMRVLLVDRASAYMVILQEYCAYQPILNWLAGQLARWLTGWLAGWFFL